MIYTRPYITKLFIAYEGDSRRTDVSLAVQIIDTFTGQPPVVPLSIRLKELPFVHPLRGQSGFYCFEGTETVRTEGTDVVRRPIPAGTYTLIVEPDLTSGNFYNLQPAQIGDPWRQGFERPVTLPMPNPQSPLVVIRLSPTAAYPFDANATLIRGTVIKSGAAVETAEVSTIYNEVDPNDSSLTVPVRVETMTDRAGEFVLFFKSLPQRTQVVAVTAVKGFDQDQIPAAMITEGKTLKNQLLDLT